MSMAWRHEQDRLYLHLELPPRAVAAIFLEFRNGLRSKQKEPTTSAFGVRSWRLLIFGFLLNTNSQLLVAKKTGRLTRRTKSCGHIREETCQMLDSLPAARLHSALGRSTL
jgi:hypothetical protein